MPKIAYSSIGCKLNQYEIQALREGFTKRGYTEVSPEECSDYYVLNTCTVTAGADRDARSLIRKYHERNKEGKIIVTGCYADAHPEELEAMPGVSFVASNIEKTKILHKVCGENETLEEDSPFFKEGISWFKDLHKAFIKVQDGCNYFCSFCKIPYVRGRLRSRAADEILSECQRLIDNGYKELVLSGVCLGSYGRDITQQNSLTQLLNQILKLSGDFRVRLSSIDPRDTPIMIAEMMKDQPKLCRHLHLSLQSGSDEILSRMRRGYTASEFQSLVDVMRKIVPDIGFSTDLIVGFPGESEEHFQETLNFLEQIHFHKVHLFPYSERTNTQAMKLGGKVPGNIIKERMKRAAKVCQTLSKQSYSKQIGLKERVLIEAIPEGATSVSGFTGNYYKCQIDGTDFRSGSLISVEIHDENAGMLFGRLTD